MPWLHLQSECINSGLPTVLGKVYKCRNLKDIHGSSTTNPGSTTGRYVMPKASLKITVQLNRMIKTSPEAGKIV